MSSPFIVSLILWNQLPKASVTAIAYKDGHIVTGLKDGNIWIYRCIIDEKGSIQLQHKVLCVGHKTPIAALTILEDQIDGCAGNNHVLISASEDGDAMKWCLLDGRCLLSVSRVFDGILRNIKPLTKYPQPSKYLLCYGFSNEILVLNNVRQTRLLTSNFNGVLKIWAFDEVKQTILKEHDNIGLLDAQGDKILELINNPYDIGVIMAVTRKFAIANRKFPSENGYFLTKPILTRHNSLPIFPNSVVENTTSVPKPELLEIICSEYSNCIINDAVTTVFMISGIDNRKLNNNWYLITFYNNVDDTSFVWKSLSTFQHENHNNDNNQAINLRESKYSSAIGDELIAVGFENGEIHIFPIHIVLVNFENILQQIQTTTNPSSSFSSSNNNPIQIFKGHNGKITCLYKPTISSHGGKYLLSGGEDCSVRIWDLENGKRLASFTYHGQQVTHFFEPPLEVCPRIRGCVISYAKDNSLAIISLEEMSCDETAHIWHTQNSELHQIVVGSNAREMLKDKSWKISSIPQKNGSIDNKNNKFQTITSYPINSPDDGITYFYVFLINIKQLINDIYHYHVSQIGSKSSRSTETTTTGIMNEEFDEKPISISKIFSWTTNSSATRSAPNLLLSSTTPSSSSISSPSSNLIQQQQSECKAIDARIVQAIVSSLMSWGNDPTLDGICIEKLGLKTPSDQLTFGSKGTNGNLSIVAPYPNDGKSVWRISHTMTAAHLLSIVGLTRSFLSMKGLEKYTSDIITHYGTFLPDLVGENFYHSSLSFLAKYFQDPVDDIRLAARTLFSSSLNNMPTEEQQSIIDYWKQFLPSVTSPEIFTNQYMVRSTMLLGIIGAEYPKVLSKKVAKNTALSLILMFHDETKLANRLIALELCVAVLKTIFGFAIDTDSNILAIMAQKTVFQIALANTPLFVSTLTHDTNNSEKPTEKIGFLKLISMFIRKKPLLLYTNLSSLAEAVVKSLDPNIPKMRDSVLPITTSVLYDLVKNFPSIAFHGESQKLAVGTLEGASIVYDLRTATRRYILEGHTKPVTAVTFSGDGRLIISCSLEEGTVRVWNNSPGLLGMIAGSLSSNNTSGMINNNGGRNGILRTTDGGGIVSNKKGFKTLSNGGFSVLGLGLFGVFIDFLIFFEDGKFSVSEIDLFTKDIFNLR
ncbi:4908_t:CDS:10 [Entrophospora sp. SA101]|nr:4908_t:CDS:10 [Entrophospora sp. SA101]